MRERFVNGSVDVADDGRSDGDPAGTVQWARLATWVIGAVLLAAVAWWFLKPPATPVEVALPAAGVVAPPPSSPPTVGDGAAAVGSSASTAGGDPGIASTTAPEVPIVVHASGAVSSPGVYRLPVGSRVDDLVRAAGGLVPEADGDRVNLAAPLVDGERIWVPRLGEVDVPEVVVGGAGGGSAGGVAGGPSSGSPGGGGPSAGAVDPAPAVVDLNTATAEELDTLPGVGPATAAAILAHREQNGPFRSVDDLLEVRGIGEAKLEQIRPLVVVT